MSITFEKCNKPNSEVTYWGDVDDVIQGRVRPECWSSEISGSSFRYGFELGAARDCRVISSASDTPGGSITPEQCGECVCAFGTCYSRGCEPGCLYYKTHFGKSIKTTGLAMVGPLNAIPDYHVEVMEEIPYVTLVERISKELNHQPFTFGGILEWREVEVTACCVAPVFEENIFDNRDKYYPKDLAGPHKRMNKSTVIHGFCAAMDKLEGSALHAGLRKVLYHKPSFMKTEAKQENTDLTMHAHLITTDRDTGDFVDSGRRIDETIIPTDPASEEISHLNGGAVTRGKLEVFIVKEMKPHSKFI
eukprot:GHVH01012291.1.p1 GENE.GHVH01012291.1~~GHVH01012291.1.p1  ORF type:complete len:305 (+),score=36.30 GHVH01012291.1:123-1037(+)